MGEVIPGLWRFESVHPEWTEDEGGGDGWEPNVAWWAVASTAGMILIDPLVDDWPALDGLLADHGGCAGVVRTCHWHQRTVAEAASRYGADVWAKQHSDAYPLDHAVSQHEELVGGLRAYVMERDDEIALWLPDQRALVFGDAMLRREDGELRMCPESWTMPEGGTDRLRALLRDLAELPFEQVLVSHGPLVLDDGPASLQAATQ
jgi:glyoxylase-like metal-dependent hydrolase (beta-lactamase superfamily II)